MSKIEKLAVKMAVAELTATQARIDCNQAKAKYREALLDAKAEINNS